MKITQKKLDDGRIQLEVVADAEEVNKALHTAQIQFAQQMNLRPVPNKTIAEVVEEATGIKDLDSVVESQALEYLAPMAMDKKNITPAYPPTPMASSQLKRDKQFAFRLFVTPKPEFELSSYEPVEVTVNPFKPDTSRVDNDIAEMAERYGEYVTDDPHPVQEGDNCLISMKCFKDGVEVPGLTTDGRTLTTGAGYMPPSFEEQIIGMNVGEEKAFAFEGPGFDDDFNEITEHYTANVKVIEIQKKIIPAVNDAWVAKYMPMYKSYEDMRAQMAEGYTKQQKKEYDNYVRQMVANKVAERFQGRIEDAIYETANKQLLQNLRAQVQQQNMTWDQFVEAQGGEQQVNMMLMLQTRSSIVQGFALDAVFRHEGLVVKDEDIREACESMNPQRPDAVRRELEDTGRNFVLREAAERMCAVRYLVDHAKITYRDPEAEEASE